MACYFASRTYQYMVTTLVLQKGHRILGVLTINKQINLEDGFEKAAECGRRLHGAVAGPIVRQYVGTPAGAEKDAIYLRDIHTHKEVTCVPTTL